MQCTNEETIDYLCSKPENLLALLTEQGKLVKELKSQHPELSWQKDVPTQLAIWKHIALKNWDNDLGKVPEDQRGPRTIKLRWRLADADKKKKSIRFQNVIRNKFFLTGAEIATIINKHMEKKNILEKFGDFGGFRWIEFIDKSAKPYTRIALTSKSVVRMPLAFPGPVLPFIATFDVRVHFAVHPYHSIIPAKLHEIGCTPELIDSGTNLFHKDFAHNLHDVIGRARRGGISQSLLISVDLKTSEEMLALAARYPNVLYAIVGVHPIDAASCDFDANSENLSKLVEQNVASKRLVAIGECGLDVEKVKDADLEAHLEKQVRWFKYQLELASKHDLPVFVHSRGTHEKTLSILQDHLAAFPKTRIIVNCFTGTTDELASLLALTADLYIVITGIIASDGRGEHLREVVKYIPADRLLLATDAPHLTPFNMPKPWPRRNEPGFLQHVCVSVASYLGKEPQQVARETTENARRAFGLPQVVYCERNPSSYPPIDFTEFQKAEDASKKESDQLKKPKAEKQPQADAVKKMDLPADSDIFYLELIQGDPTTAVGFVVSAKEKGILAKQQGLNKTPEELIELASIMELFRVPPNTVVMKGPLQVFQST